MYSFSLWASALTIFCLHSIATGYIAPDECVEDDVLLSLQEWIVDADPFCRNQLGIDDITSTSVLPTSRTTITEHRTTDVTISRAGTTTVPSATITISVPAVTEALAIKIPKRAPVPTAAAQFYNALPFARSIRDGVAPDELVSSVASGCECLYLETQTVQVFSTPETTRTLTANARRTIIQYRNTLSAGITTEIAIGTPSITSSLISIPTIPSSSQAVVPPFNNITSRSTIFISTTLISIESSITLPIPTLPSSGFYVSTVGLPTRSFNLSASISNIPTPSTPPLSSVNITSIIGSTGLAVPTPSFNIRLPTSTPNLTNSIGPFNITSIIGSTGLPLRTPSFTKPTGPVNTTSIIGSTGLSLSTPSFSKPIGPLNITSVIGSTGLPLPTPSFSPTISLNNSLNGNITLGPTASIRPSAAPINFRNYTELSSSCSSLGLLVGSGTTSSPAPPSLTVITSTSIILITSILHPAVVSTVSIIPIPTSILPPVVSTVPVLPIPVTLPTSRIATIRS